jgi:hypothetical protein
MRISQKLRARIAICLLCIFSIDLLIPFSLLALSGGPTQPEFVGFSPVSASNLVDPFTGDVSYNIPLFEIGGYPLNLAYNGASNMEAEASWVGLGWTLNPGAINRDVRGVPDDFKGDEITRNVNLRKNWTVGVSASVSAEVFGSAANKKFPKDFVRVNLGFSLTVTYNNYNGLGIEQGLNVSASIGKKGGTGFTGGLGISNGPSGFSANSNLGLSGQKQHVAGSIGIAGGFNSRSGLNELSITANVRPVVNASVTREVKDENGIVEDVTKTESLDIQGMSDLASASSSISFGHTPAFRMSALPLLNRAATYRASVGGELFGTHPGMSFRGFYNEQKLNTKEIIKPAYGCLYSESASEDAITDYSVEKDVPLTNTTTNLPLPYMTSDMYGVMAHGIGGQFRIKRSDNGVFHQSKTTLEASGMTIGVEAGAGNLFHGGADITTPTTENNSGQWVNSNTISLISLFKPTQNTAFIPAYFYNNSESQLFPYDESEASMIQPILPKSVNEGKKLSTLSTYSNGKSPSAYEMQSRITNKTALSYLTAEEASIAGLQKTIYNYPAQRIVFGNYNREFVTSISRLSHPEHHISEITVTKEDGMRYIFGIPAYNKIKKESTFNLGAPNVSSSSNAYATYNPSEEDNSINNQKGLDRYFDQTVTPEYATSYLLTAVATPNYVDITGNGISSDDIGDIVQFNYTRVYADYKWRTPYDQNSVNHSPGHKVVTDDSKGSYIYGEKEVWLNHSIESKDQIAIFYSSAVNRKDAIEPKDSDGGIADNPRKSYQLDSIAVFSKAELLAHPENPTPIKTVVFKYDFSLFPGSSNVSQSGVGKLTLKQVYFTYGKSYRGKLNPYVFNYNLTVDNEIVQYQLGATDRWGGIKLENSNGLALDEYPYVEQDKQLQDQYAALGQLKSIQLPSGALIEIDYESDDYAFVNDLPAASMIMIAGVGETPNFEEAGKSELNDLSLSGFNYKPYIFFEIPENVTTQSDVYEKFFEGILKDGDKQIYFDFALDLNDESIYDRIKGYFKYLDCGIDAQSATNRYGWVKISPVADQENDYHPATLAGLQKLRLEIPQKAYPQSYIPPGDINVLSVATNVATNIGRMVEELVGFNLTSTLAGKCTSIDVNSSWIRLKDPDGRKLGGGSRVKKVSISDLINHQYYKLRSGQKYQYKIVDENSPRNSYSSGVACYEPMLGGEENPSRMVIASVEKVKIAPDNFYYSELPMGEQLFPSPSVGYSQVQITPFGGEEEERGIGYEIKRFYTSKDYPTYTLQTEPEILSSLNTPMKIFNFNRDTYFSALQGYTVVVNDMHGKPKADESYAKNGSLINKTEYLYDDITSGMPKRSVANDVKIVDATGNISDGILGVDMEVYQEYSEASTTSSTPGLMGNLDVFSVPWVLPIPVPLNLFAKSTQTTRTGCVTKFIKKAGILRKIKTTNEYGAVAITENLLFDKETGSMIMSSTTNTFGEKIYSLNMPAYWGYPRMGPATEDLGLVFETNLSGPVNAPDFSYFASNSGIASLIEEGAEFYVKPSSESLGIFKKYFLLKDVYGATLVDELNQPLASGNYLIKVVRSGRKNLLGQNLQTITTRINPISDGRLDIGSAISNNVLNASAIEFDDYSKIKCNEYVKVNCNSIFKRDFERSSQYSNFGYLIDAFIHYSRFYEGPAFTNLNDLLNWFEENANISIPSEARDEFNQSFPVINLPEPNGTPWIKVDFGPDCYIDVRPKHNRFGVNTVNRFIGTERENCLFPSLQNVDEIMNYLSSDCDPLNFDYSFLSTNSSLFFNVGWQRLNGEFKSQGYALIHCSSCTYECDQPLTLNNYTNPYALGLKGNWAPFRAYTFMGERSRPITEEATNLSRNGYLQNWSAFWQFDPNEGNKLKKPSVLSSSAWVAPNQITLKDNRGNTLEEKDAINRYSSAIFSYDNNFNTAVASNARYQDIANDHFEDYNFKNDLMDRCFKAHWNFKNALENSENAAISTEEAHSGLHSLKIEGQSDIKVSKELNDVLYTDSLDRDGETKRYLLKAGDCLKEFSPTAGQQYMISGWIKPSEACKTTLNHAGISIDLNGEVYTFLPKGPTIDGWQKVEGIFEVSSNQTSIDVKLYNEESHAQFFDDIRIHPLNSNMKCFVYHPQSLKLMATLDENNYASYYEYDAEGKLVRIKKETERGIVTLKENRQQLYRPTN